MIKFKSFLLNLSLVIVFIGIFPTSAQADSFVSFFRAVEADDTWTVRRLLERGFDPNTMAPPELQGLSPLAMAIRNKSPKVVEVLLAHPQLDVNYVSPHGETALMMAALRGELSVARRLLQKGAHAYKAGWAPLHYAATGGHVEIIDLLLEHHAFIDAQSPNGSTPLMMAARYGSEAAVDRLLQAGADVTMRNQDGATVVDYARASGRDYLADRLARQLGIRR